MPWAWAGRLTTTAGLGGVLAMAGILSKSAALLALSFPFFAYAAALLAGALTPSAAHLAVTRRLSAARVEEGEEVDVTLDIENRGDGLHNVGIADRVPWGALCTSGEASTVASLAAGAMLTLRYRLRPPRGVHVLPGIDVITWDRLGLVPIRRPVDVPSGLLVLPKVEALETIRIRPRRTRVYSGTVRANLGGSGTDFFGCRAYSSGDEVRRINWRATARREDLVVTDYEQERVADVSVILDARERAHAQVGSDASTFDYAVHAAASVSLHFLRSGNNVGLLIYGDYLNWTYPGYGRAQREKILVALAAASTADKVAFEDLRYLPTRLFPSGSQLVVVSPLADEKDLDILGILRARGYQVILISPNPLYREAPPDKHDRAVETARRLLDLGRSALISSLVAMGVEVVDWDLRFPLSLPVARLLSAKGRRLA